MRRLLQKEATPIMQTAAISKKAMRYDATPETGDIVVIAATPFIDWLMWHDAAFNPGLRKIYNYDILEPRKDKLERWLWATSEVVEFHGEMVVLKASIHAHAAATFELLTGTQKGQRAGN